MERKQQKVMGPKRPQQRITDERFTHALNDPIYRRVPKNERRIDIDKRFQSMFHDKQFKTKYTVDKRGRPIDLTTSEDLRQYYNLVEDEEEGDAKFKEKDSKNQESSSEESGSDTGPGAEDDEIEGNVKESDITKRDPTNQLSKTMKKRLRDNDVDYARGDGLLVEDESSDDSSSSADEECLEDTTHAWGELDHDAERTEKSTSRLALCNMDWDRLKAVDLMVLFHSFLPPGGVLKTVDIYKSEYGKERLAEEEVHGPLELRTIKADSDNEDTTTEFEPRTENEDDEEGEGYQMEKLRQYQLNRLKYFYAVLEFDSIETAEKIYTECDGMEYESSATRVDLRYIPEDMAFDDEPTDKCDALPQAEKYRPRFFTTTALQQAKVRLTWDETDPLRRELTQKIHNPKEKVDDEDLRAYLASSESEDEINGCNDANEGSETESNVDPIAKYRALLDSIETQEKKNEKDVEMEITWGVGLKEKTESLVKKKLEEETSATLTPWEEILAKKKEKMKKKRVEKKSKNKEEDEIPSENEMFSDDDVEVDMSDPFFKDEIASNEIMKTAFQKKKSKKKLGIPGTKAEKSEAETAALELLLMDDTDDKQHFSLKKIMEAENESKSLKKKNRKWKKVKDDVKAAEDTFEVDVADSRFSALFSSHLYNVDPSDPNFKRTKGMETIIHEKQKRRMHNEQPVHEQQSSIEEPSPGAKVSKKTELTSLVKSVKRNTQNLKNNIKKHK